MKLKGFPSKDPKEEKKRKAALKFDEIMKQDRKVAADFESKRHLGRLTKLQGEILEKSPPPVNSLESLQSEVVVSTFIQSVRADMARQTSRLSLGFTGYAAQGDFLDGPGRALER